MSRVGYNQSDQIAWTDTFSEYVPEYVGLLGAGVGDITPTVDLLATRVSAPRSNFSHPEGRVPTPAAREGGARPVFQPKISGRRGEVKKESGSGES